MKNRGRIDGYQGGSSHSRSNSSIATESPSFLSLAGLSQDDEGCENLSPSGQYVKDIPEAKSSKPSTLLHQHQSSQ